MTDSITRKEFYEELRKTEERSRENTEKSHMALAITISNNIGSIKKTVESMSDTFNNHINDENVRQQKLDTVVNKLENVDFTVLQKSLDGYKNWGGFKETVLSFSKWIVIIGSIVTAILSTWGVLIWIAKQSSL